MPSVYNQTARVSLGEKSQGLLELSTSDGVSSMPIAVIGIGGRFPGSASNPEKLWELLSQGRSALREVPKDRFNIDAFYHPHAERQGTLNVRGAHFLEGDIAAFDAPFFSITPGEAKAMDPQQRMILEVAYESIENAGLRMETVIGSNTSCYVGCFTKDYSDMLSRDIENIKMYNSTGNGSAMLSNRLSWFYDLKGPSLSLDTACSSSLVALHLACQSLRTGESSMSIVGGTNFILMPDIMVSMTALHFLSPDSRCQSFDKKANGYSRGEGAACVILKPLHAALRDNDVIRAVIRGTAVNQDGKTPGITLPSMHAQEDLIRTAYRNAGLGLADTSYFEAHGTGTPAGDPLEAGSLGSTFGQARGPGSPIFVGSVKTNIGHMEGASGLAGLIKAVYALEKGAIPANLWFEEANPRIQMDELNIKIPTQLTPWPSEGIRRASVNSFGYGGTNAHVILDDALNYLEMHGLAGHHNTLKNAYDVEAPSIDASPSSEDSSDTSYVSQDQVAPRNLDYFYSRSSKRVPKLIVMSSQDQGGVDRMQKVLMTYLESKIEVHGDAALLGKLAYTMAQRRSRLAWKTFAVASTAKELCTALGSQSLAKAVRSSQTPNIGFVFTGQGAQWHAMGRELFSHQVFRQSLVSADKYLKSLGCSWSLIEELWRDEESTNVNQATYSQPLCTALQVALVDTMAHWAIKPTCVVGHSSGEIAAAYCKGSITRESAWKLSYHRGRLSQSVKTLAPDVDGAMMAVGIGEEKVKTYLARVANRRVVVSCINSPVNVTVSGDTAGIAQLRTMLDADGIFARKLKVNVAYHSRHMMLIAQAYFSSIEDLQVSEGDSKIAMFSSVTGEQINSANLGAQYWVDNLVSPVRFLQAVRSLEDYTGNTPKTRRDKKPAVDILVELGPHAVLQGPLKQILGIKETKMANISYVSMLHRNSDANETALIVAGRLFALGYPVDIPKVNGPQAGPQGEVTATLVDLPPYPWNRSARYWFESQMAHCYRFRKHPRHDLFGAITPDSSTIEPRWRNFLRLSESPWIEDHRVQSSVLYPAAGMIVMAIQAAHETIGETKELTGFDLRDINIGKALIVPHDEDGVETMIQLRPWRTSSQTATTLWQHFNISSRAKDQGWQEHCSGLICSRYKASKLGPFPDEDDNENKQYLHKYNTVKSECSRVSSPRHFYQGLETIGLNYGPTFQNIVGIASGNYQSSCVLRIPDTKVVMPMKYEFPHVIHPCTLDSIFQMALPALTPINKPLHVAMVPTFIESLFVSSDISSTPGDQLRGYSVAGNPGFREAEATIVVADNTWKQPQVIVKNLRCTALSGMTENVASRESASNIRKLCAEFVWKEDIDFMSSEDATDLFKKAADRYSHLDPIVIEELELGAFIYIERILKTFTPDEARTFVPHLQLFYQWMQHQHELALRGAIEHQSPRIDWLNLSDDYQTDLLRRVAADSVDGEIMCRVGDRLEKIMTSTIEPLQVLLEDDLLYKWYHNGVGMDEGYAQLTEYMDKVAHKRPYINILEIGAGTGGTTLPLLRVLGGEDGTSPRFASYTFTDISSGFFEKAQETFKPWTAFMTFKRLNVEEEPIVQGFQAETYDVIVAANVLHASHSMDKTLANVRTLLKPGGKLVLCEITHMLQRFPMIIGCLPGWWMGEADGRKWGPTMTEGAWHDVLARQGFSGVDMTLHEYPDPKDHAVAVMVSTALPSPEVAVPAAVVIVQPASMDEELSGLSAEIAKLLAGDSVSASIVNLQDIRDYPLQGCSCIVLVEVSSPLLYQIQSFEFDAVKKIILESASTLWVTKGAAMASQQPEASLMTGLGRTIRAENPNLALGTLDLDPDVATATTTNAKCILKVMTAISNPSFEIAPDWEYALRDGVVFIPRVIAQRETNAMLDELNLPSVAELGLFKCADRPLRLDIGVPGMLDTLQFVDDFDAANGMAHDDVEIEVKASGLNFHDIMISMGQLSDSTLGCECSGVVRRVGGSVTKVQPGDRVMTWRLGCHQNYVRNPEMMVYKVPNAMSFEIAASIPVIYCTVYHALIDRARLCTGESILIHAAAGGVGQAAVTLSQYLGAEIFVTVSSEEKKGLLMEKYAIPEDHIFNSRDLSFAKGVMRMTDGRGVDVVLNSLAGEALRQTWHCTAMFGRFVEIGKTDIVGNTGLDMAPFENNVTFLSVNLAGMYRHNVPLAAKVFQGVVELMHRGVVRAVEPLNVYNYSQMEIAFRTMQAGKSMGKIVLKPNDEDLVPTVPRRKREVELDGNSTYLLAGGLGGLGRSIARWMVEHGAQNLVFISRSGVQKGDARKLIEELQAKNVTVAVHACDVSDRKELKAIFDECARSMPPIRGILQSAMVLQDSTFENMTCDDFTAAVRPKVQGSWSLHLCAPQGLDFFVMLSSCAGVSGSRGQGNYAAGNTYQDALANYRRAHNLAATTIDVGMILDVGFVAENTEAIENLKNWGFIGVREEEFHLILAAAIRGTGAFSAAVPAQLITGLGTGGMIKQSGANEPFWFSDAKFAHMRLLDTQSDAQDARDGTRHLHALLQQATSLAEASDIVCKAIAEKLAKSMMVAVEDIDAGRPVNAYGVDSLVAVELRNWIFREMEADVSVFDILSSVPISVLGGKIAAKSGFLAVAVLEGAEA